MRSTQSKVSNYFLLVVGTALAAKSLMARVFLITSKIEIELRVN